MCPIEYLNTLMHFDMRNDCMILNSSCIIIYVFLLLLLLLQCVFVVVVVVAVPLSNFHNNENRQYALSLNVYRLL